MLTLDNLSGDQRMLAEIIGLEKYLEVVKMFGGSAIYISTSWIPCPNHHAMSQFAETLTVGISESLH